MNSASLNDIGITVAGILGMLVFYWIGKKAYDEKSSKKDARSGKEKSCGEHGEGVVGENRQKSLY